MTKRKLGSYATLHIGVLIYSASVLFMKLAGGSEPFSLRFFGFYALTLLALGIYALIWQQVLKILPLGTAYANRAMAVVWNLLLGVLVFKESLRLTTVLGSLIIIVGVILVVGADE